MTVTVGRIVHFYDAHVVGDNGDGPYAAIVTKVWSPTCVNLSAFGMGAPYLASSVQEHPLGTSTKPPSQYWQWPPKV